MKTEYRVQIGRYVFEGGMDAESKVKSIQTTETEGGETDTATIVIEDGNKEILPPEKNVSVLVELRKPGGPYVQRFEGFVTSSPVSFGGETTMTISAESLDTESKAKEPMQLFFKEGKLGEVFDRFAKLAELKPPRISKAIADLVLDREVADGESFLEFGDRVSKEVGGLFKVIGKTPVLVDAMSALSVSGKALPEVVAEAGVNLIGGTITPRLSRPAHASHKARYFDKDEGTVKTAEAEGKRGSATTTLGPVLPDKARAERAVKAEASTAEREQSAGTIEMTDCLEATAGGTVKLIGGHPGVDGTFRIKSVENVLDEGGLMNTLSVDHLKALGTLGLDVNKQSQVEVAGREI